MTAFCAAIDWGTTNCRVWLLDAQGAILARDTSAEGMSVMAPERYPQVVEAHLARLRAPAGLPVVVCGMAGSRDGWCEAPYFDTPARLDQIWRGAVPAPATQRDVRILPGVCQRDPASPDVMRGEETQIAGACALGAGDGVYCLPGTHSKWAMVADECIGRFHTFLTGELFALLARHSVLTALMDEATEIHASHVFTEAVDTMLAHPQALTRELFGIRAGILLDTRRRSAARARLSGLLIGAEIAGALKAFGAVRRVTLVSGAGGPNYEAALRQAGMAVARIDAEAATVQGLHRAAVHLFGAQNVVRRA